MTALAVDPRVYTNWSARMASSLFLAHVALVDDPRREEYRAAALRTVDRLLAKTQDDDGGMFHMLAPDGTRGEKGLLSDQIWMALAALDAYAHTRDANYRAQARRIAAFLIRTLLAPTAFVDRALNASDLGLLTEPVYGLPNDSIAASLFLRLAWLTGEETYQQIAARILAGFGEAYATQGVFAAGYALAWARMHSEPRHVVIVGPRDDPHDQAPEGYAVARRRKDLPANVRAEVEVRVIDPDRVCEVPRHAVDSLAVAGDQVDPLLDRLLDPERATAARHSGSSRYPSAPGRSTTPIRSWPGSAPTSSVSGRGGGGA